MLGPNPAAPWSHPCIPVSLPLPLLFLSLPRMCSPIRVYRHLPHVRLRAKLQCHLVHAALPGCACWNTSYLACLPLGVSSKLYIIAPPTPLSLTPTIPTLRKSHLPAAWAAPLPTPDLRMLESRELCPARALVPQPGTETDIVNELLDTRRMLTVKVNDSLGLPWSSSC